ncbi:MAG: NAD-dependent DNA ligase LigA [Candidatus Gracilibacteria bacterium]|nr:NAD-dependent DNA ligase LigA [Candidatus Gracilibacteria bacterium]
MLELSKKYLKMSFEELKEQDLKKLQDLISYHSDLYYNKDEPIISDSEYDSLFKKLEYLEKKFGVKNKQTSLVGADIIESTFEKVKHSRPMISLDNTYNEEDLRDFDERVIKNIPHSISPKGREVATYSFSIGEKDIGNTDRKIEYCLEFKFDGLGIELIYKNGKLVQAITRGNGIEGEDVTVNVMQIDNIPKTISYKEHLEVRGEVVMPNSVFEELNVNAKIEGSKVFSNPRNAASGSLRMKDSSVTKKRKLKFFAYDLANFDEYTDNMGLSKYGDVIYSLANLGFEISSYFKKLNGIEEIISAINNFGDVKKTIDFDIDGLVIKVNDISLWEVVGWTEHHPRYAIAYKFPAEILTTKIISVDHQVGKTGTITPVANLEPINISGVIVRRATLHNYEEVENLDVRIGDSVFIKRAGEVIPKIISVVNTQDRNNLEKIVVPEFCPSCETKIVKDENKVRFYCPNTIDCPAQHIEKLVFSVGKNGFDIDGFGEKQVELFLTEGIIHNLADIFKIAEKREEILLLEGFKEKSVSNLIAGVESAKYIDITRFIMGLTIPGVGKKTAKTISCLFKSKEDLLDFSYSLEELQELDDIGPEIGQNIIDYFNNEAHKRILEELLNYVVLTYFVEKTIIGNSIFNTKSVCITGSFEGFSRDELAKKLEEVGGKFITSVSKNTDFLLAGEKAGSKLEKANSLGVKVIYLNYFLDNL